MSQPVSYHYDRFPPQNIDWQSLISLIGPANAALARYDATLRLIPNAALLLSPLTTQEAVLSSRIEGTQATMGEVFEYEAAMDSQELSLERREDINEVLNYRHAMRHAVEALQNLPLCQRVIRDAHCILLDSVRGHEKAPGEYRQIPNWIGAAGCAIEEARYVPISAERLPESMSAWERDMHVDALDRLIQLAILHAEFEALHPFLDGNGRIGRMFVPLFMFSKGLIERPMFYISAFFEANRDEYYERLLAISRDHDWSGWCAFFLRAVTEQAQENQNKAAEMLRLYETKKSQIVDLTHSQHAIYALDYLFVRPIFKASDFTGCGSIPKPTATRILSVLRENGILKTLREASGRRPAVYAFTALLNAAEGRKIF